MYTFFLKIAGFVIKLTLNKTENILQRKRLKNSVKNFYKDFLVKEQIKVDASVKFIEQKSPDIITNVKDKKTYINFYHTDKKTVISYYHIHLFQLQFIIFSLLENLLIKRAGFILHSSSNNVNGKAVIFTGKQGSGKSTIAQLLSYKYPILTDDVSIIKKENKDYYLYQIPSNEKIQFSKSILGLKIQSLFFLRKDKITKIRPIKDDTYIFNRLIKQVIQKTSQKQTITVLNFINNVPAYFIYFNRSRKDVVRLGVLIRQRNVN